VSAIFLYKLYQYGYHKSEDGITPAIFAIALGNYVIPCVPSLVAGLSELADILLY
jgi:hypothetical protein